MALILGFDTSAAHCAAALLDGEALRAARHEDMARGQAERLVGLLDEVLEAAGARWPELDALAVGIGPGNFTGIRISVAAARGLALGLGRPASGVSMLEALAHGLPGPVLAVLPAPRGALALQRFGPGARGPLLAAPDALPAGLADDAATLVGPGAEALAARLAVPAARIVEPLHPPAEAIARIAATRDRTAAPRPAPLYLRPADAAPPREAPPRIVP